MGALSVCRVLCCVVLVLVNIGTILLGVIFTLLGCLFTWGFAVLANTFSSLLTTMTSSITDMLKPLNISLDVVELLKNLVQITGSVGALFLTIGIVLIVVGCFGCCGACCSSKVCLIVYTVAIGIIFLAQLIIVIIWFSDANLVKKTAETGMIDSLKKYTGIRSTNIQSLVQNIVQIFVGCCGINNGTDFHIYSTEWVRSFAVNRSGYYFEYNLTYPVTCCKFNLTSFSPKDEWCSYNNTNSETSWYQVGCYAKIFEFINEKFNLDIIFYVLGGILGVQLLLCLGAVIIIIAISNQERKVSPH